MPTTTPAQDQPGVTSDMDREPLTLPTRQFEKLKGNVAVITGGDSGIGRAVAELFALHGANIVFTYTNKEGTDAADTVATIRRYGQEAISLCGDLRSGEFCTDIIDTAARELGQINILVNNAAVQYPQKSLLDITDAQMAETFEVNIYSYLRVSRAALPFLIKHQGCIINTASVVAFKGHEGLIDYTATKGAIIGFTRALALNVAPQGVRVNAVAPGPIWTPLIPSSFAPKKVAEFGQHVPLGRPGEANEVAPAYLYLASQDGSYVTGQTIHVNGGDDTAS